MGLGHLGRLLNVGDQILPGGGKALIGLGFGAAFDQGFDHALGTHLFATPLEDLLLQLGNQGIALFADLDGELRHRKGVHCLISSIKRGKQQPFGADFMAQASRSRFGVGRSGPD